MVVWMMCIYWITLRFHAAINKVMWRESADNARTWVENGIINLGTSNGDWVFGWERMELSMRYQTSLLGKL